MQKVKRAKEKQGLEFERVPSSKQCACTTFRVATAQAPNQRILAAFRVEVRCTAATLAVRVRPNCCFTSGAGTPPLGNGRSCAPLTGCISTDSRL